MSLLHIDGSQGEGGGQVLRTALTLSVITQTPIEVTNIRAGRRKPGLAPQHLAGVRAAAEICDADVEGARLRASAITFKPGGPARGGDYTFDISRLAGTPSAGSITLLLQTVLVPLALAVEPSRLALRGGTHVAWSPPLHYVEWVLLPTLARVGIHATLKLTEWGWYPEGGGKVAFNLHGSTRLQGLDLTERGAVAKLHGLAVATNLPSHIPQRISARANNLLREAGLPANVQPLRNSGPSTGAGVFMALEHTDGVVAGFSALGSQGKPSEIVALEGVEPLLAYHAQSGVLDRYLPDHLLLPLALADGPSTLTTVELTQHTLTNAAVIGRFLARDIHIEGNVGEPGNIRVTG